MAQGVDRRVGPGSLTRAALLEGATDVVAVEKDVRFHGALKLLCDAVPDHLSVQMGDLLKASPEYAMTRHAHVAGELTPSCLLDDGGCNTNLLL